MSKIFSGHQPNFLPYLGVLYKLYRSECFIWDDDVQFTNKEYKSDDGVRIGHNTNAIRIGDKRSQITVPVSYTFGDKINEVKICYDKNWEEKLLKTLVMNYGKYPYFEEGYNLVKNALDKHYEYLIDLNMEILNEIVKRFGFKTKIYVASRDCPTDLLKNERNIYQCKKLGCDRYLSGQGGHLYNDEEMYKENGIEIEYLDFEPTPYRQYHKKTFIPNLSVLDYIFNEGYKIPKEWEEKEAKRWVKKLQP